MAVFIAIVSFLAVIIVLVLAHEFGHFITAKIRGVRVIEFGLFYPPRLFSFTRGGTIYSINLIPLGGFTKMAGEEDPSIKDSLASKGVGTRLLVLSAGALMNIILPFILFSVAFMVPHDVMQGRVVINDVVANSPAAQAGIEIGDTLLAVNGKKLNNNVDLSRDVQLNLGNKIKIKLQHADGTIETVTLTPRWKPPAGQGAMGILVGTENATAVRESVPIWRAIPEGAVTCVQTFVLFKNGIIGMISGATPAQFTGPVGIAQLTGEVASAGISPLMEFAAFLSINLAIFNIFPLPGLDGGRIVFVLLEWVRRGKRIPARIEGMVHLAGFALLILFFLAITYQDIARIVSGGSLTP